MPAGKHSVNIKTAVKLLSYHVYSWITAPILIQLFGHYWPKEDSLLWNMIVIAHLMFLRILIWNLQYLPCCFSSVRDKWHKALLGLNSIFLFIFLFGALFFMILGFRVIFMLTAPKSIFLSIPTDPILTLPLLPECLYNTQFWDKCLLAVSSQMQI